MKPAYLLPLLAILFLSGCVTLSVDQSVDSSGHTDISTVIVMPLAGSGCANATRPGWASDYSCSYNGTATIIHMAGKLPSNMFTASYGIPYITYRLDMSPGSIGEQNQSGKASPSQIAMLKAYGISMSWKVTMPGKITNAHGGERIGNSTVKFDLLAMAASGKPLKITVESQELNWIPVLLFVAAIGIAVLLLVGGAVLLFLLKARRI